MSQQFLSYPRFHHVRHILFLLALNWISLRGFSQDIQIFESFEDFEPALNKEDDKIHVIHFWATWCAPCIGEMPYFEKLRDKYPDKIEVLFVSLDFRSQYKSMLIPFVQKYNIKAPVVLLADPKLNDWIDLVDPAWSGAIPATYFYTTDKQAFRECQYHSVEELESEIRKLFNL